MPKRGRRKSGLPGTENYKVPGPAKKTETVDKHVNLPKDLVDYIDDVTDNVTQWLVDAAQQRRKREQEQSS